MYRQGDVLLVPIENRPWPTKTLRHCVVAHGEVTGHTHRFEAGAEQLEDKAGNRFIVVSAPEAALVHEEHGTLTIPQGVYRVVHQREYVPGPARATVVPHEPELAAPIWARGPMRKMRKVADRVQKLAEGLLPELSPQERWLDMQNRARRERGLSDLRLLNGQVLEQDVNGNWRRVAD